MRVTILSTPITGTVYGRFHQLLLSKATSQLSFKFSDSLLINAIMLELLLPYSNTPILKAWGSTSQAHCPLTKGIVRQQFPSLRGTMLRDNGRSMWNCSHFKHICAFYVEITNIHKVKLKVMIKTNLSGFVVTMHSGLCKHYVKYLGLTPSGFDFLFCTRPHALWQQTSPELVLIP